MDVHQPCVFFEGDGDIGVVAHLVGFMGSRAKCPERFRTARYGVM